MQERGQSGADAREAAVGAAEQVVSDMRPGMAEQARRSGEDENGRRMKGFTRCIFCFDCIPNKEFGDHFSSCMRAKTSANV